MPSTMWCMIGLPTIVISKTLAREIFAFATRLPTRSSSEVLIALVSSASPPGFIITYDTRLMRSSPKRICGFIKP
ncbi:unannotated protein [freshwater metagenome]|uniref:Unannotated protein n=1 Tax=freshwater metagenome TaxID=449393 RepID=A0A6J6YUM1_9ZZZZ